MGKVSLTDNMEIQTLYEQRLLDRSTKPLDISKRLKTCVEAGGGHFEHSQGLWNSDILSSVNHCVVQTMLLNWCCSLNIFITEKSVGGHVKKSTTPMFFNRIKFHSSFRCKTCL